MQYAILFPDKNKIAKVIPSHKKGSTKDVNNFRPISLLSIFSKIMEKLMTIRLTNFLDLHSIIFPISLDLELDALPPTLSSPLLKLLIRLLNRRNLDVVYLLI